MDFLDPKKKRANNIRLFIGYALMSILIGIGTLILLFFAYGFSFNLQTGNITQNGLLFIDAAPEPAQVIINGENRGQTDRHLILPSGNYNLELRRDGYRTWSRTFLLGGGQIERFIYPFLFPSELETSEQQLFAAQPPLASQSPDRRWLLVQQPGSYLNFSLIDLSEKTPNSATISLSKDLLVKDGKKHNLTLVEWSTDNRHLVVRHSHDKGSEFVLIDTKEVAKSANLTKTFSTPFTSLALKDKKFDKYYLHDSATQTLKTAELGSPTINVILTQVLSFKAHGDDVLLYATTEGADKNTVNINVREGSDIFNIRKFPAGTSYLLDAARFEGKWYMVAAAVSEQKIYVLRDPVAALKRDPSKPLVPATVLRLEKPEYVSFSNNARFVAVQAGSAFAVYDAENDTNYKYDTGFKLGKGDKATWMDGHRLTLVSENQLRVFDFDGINVQSLVASYARFMPFFDRDYQALYTLAPSTVVKGRAALLRTELIVKSN